MIQKIIRLRIKDNCLDRFLAQQQVWNDAMAAQPGFVSVTVGTEIDRQNWVTIVIQFQSRADLDRFMSGAHDRLETSTRISELIDELDVKLLDLKLFGDW